MKVKRLLFAGLATCVMSESASSLAAKGDGHLSAGEFQDAISAYGSAIQMEPGNYLYMFKRSAAYMSVGKNLPALDDLEKVLELKPGFEGALSQRARLNMKLGNFDLAIKDAKSLDSQGLGILEDAEQAVKDEHETEKLAKKKNWEECVNKATEVLRVAAQSLKTRKLRAKCRLATGESVAALADLNNVASLTPSDPEPFVTMANVYYYSLGDYDKALQQVQRCLRFDQDSKPCKAAHKQIRKTHKQLKSFDEATRTKKAPSNPYWAEAINQLVTDGQLEKVKIEAAHAFKHAGLENGSNLLVEELTDVLCDAYYFTGQYQDGEAICDDTLRRNPAYLNAILLKAQKEVAAERYEAAMNILGDAVKNHGVRDSKIDNLFDEAQTLLIRAATKDYYKILDCPRNADAKTIKKAFRDQTRKFHPDKYKGDMDLEEVERKMAEINEAYEILSDEDTRRRYDMGEDFTHGGQNGQGGSRGNGFPGGFHFANGGGRRKPPGGGGGQQFHFNFPGGGGGGGGGDFGGFDFGQFMRQAQGGRS